MASEYADYQDALGDDTEWEHRAGCVRITPGTLHSHPTDDRLLVCPGLYIHSNHAHVNTGLVEVGIERSSGRIRLLTDGATAGAPIITGDEMAARNRLMFGASGGNDYVNIEVSNASGRVNLSSQSAYNSIAHANLNLWVAFHSPAVRTQGQPSRLSRLEASLADALARVEVLETAAPPPVHVNVGCGMGARCCDVRPERQDDPDDSTGGP